MIRTALSQLATRPRRKRPRWHPSRMVTICNKLLLYVFLSVTTVTVSIIALPSRRITRQDAPLPLAWMACGTTLV